MSSRIVALSLAVLSVLTFGSQARADRPKREAQTKSHHWSVADLYGSASVYALGHRGYGSDAFDPSGPLENTLDGIHQGFRDGIRVVELDLQRTADGKIVVFHDDFLADFTCISALTYDELLALRPQVPLFRAVLNSSRHFGQEDCLSGIVFAEMKVPVPLCDGANTSEQAAISESELVAAVVKDIRQARMEDRVILNSGSPSILKRAAEQAPEIRRALSLDALQLLTPEDVCRMRPELCPVRIPKSDCGLEWYNVGPIARLPRYLSFPQFLQTAVGCAGSSAVSLDKRVLLQNPAAAPIVIGGVHQVGLEAIVWTVDTQAEWNVVAGAGADGITTNNIALGLERQAPSTCSPSIVAGLRDGELAGGREALAVDATGDGTLDLALDASRANDGTVRVEFALPDRGPARLDLVDVVGRLVETSDVGSFGPGRHAFTLGRDLRSGIYLVRLTHERGQMRAKVAVVR